MWIYLKTGILMLTLGLALFYDIREKKIRNFITLPAALMGCAINVMEHGMLGLEGAVQGWFGLVVLLAGFYRINVMGAGDIKLLAAIGAIMGLRFALFSLVASIYFGGFIAVILLIRRRAFQERLNYFWNYLSFIFIFRRIPVYCQKYDHASKFIFSAAVVPGTVFYLILSSLNFPLIRM